MLIDVRWLTFLLKRRHHIHHVHSAA